MENKQKRNVKLWILGTIIIGILVVELCVLLALTIAYGRENRRTDIYKSEQVQSFLNESQNEEVKGVFYSMFSLENYDVNDFLTYRGIHTVMLNETLQSGEAVLAITELLLEQEQSVELAYIGICPDFEQEDNRIKIKTGASSWEEELLEMIKANPQIYFHLILEYPSAYEISQLEEAKKEQLYSWYYDMAQLFTPTEEYQNMVLFMPGAESWLSGNDANYLENGEPNKDVASSILRRMVCDYIHILNTSNVENKVATLQESVKTSREPSYKGENETYVFFGDSVIGNYTDSMSIPGVVQGFTNAKVINCGYGGLAAARENSDGISLTDVVDAFLSGEYAQFADDKPIKSGIQTFYEQSAEIEPEKLTFFISIGLNDYMSGISLKGIKSEERYHFEGAVQYVITQLQEAYPDSEIVLLTPNFLGLFDNGTMIINDYTMEDLVNSLLEISNKLGLKCIDVFHELGIDGNNKLTYLADQCHPNELGRYEIGKLVYQYLEKWSREEDTVAVSVAPRPDGYGAYADIFENLENNVFFDSLVYTGYNIEKHRSDGLMWHYVLAANKRGKGWLSDITYNGGSEGYEMTADGLPDIEFFEKNGLVCASYVTYVYFNYLPNIAGIDTAELTRPEKAYNANDWYVAAKDWVEKGYSKKIDFEAELKGGFIDFDEMEEIPIGSIIAFCDSRNKSDYCSHVVIYAGYENDYHWVFHVGNENGPEFCSIERMHFGPDPQWPIAVITTPEQVLYE